MKIGVVTKSQESNFRIEMATVKEAVHMRIAADIAAQETKSNGFDYELVSLDDTDNWSTTLKMELVTWRDEEEFNDIDLEINRITKNFVKKNFKRLLGNGENLREIYYVRERDFEEKKYIYDKANDIVYKIPQTHISIYTVHSIEQLDYLLTGKKEEKEEKIEYTAIAQVAEIKNIGNISYYEPDLSSLAQETTSLIFYKMNGESITNIKKEISANQWIAQGKPNEITESSDKYILYNYEKKFWANIKVVNTKGTDKTEDDVESWWTWIPRYAYKNIITDSTKETSVEFITTNNKKTSDNTELSEGYEIAETFKNNTKTGIWISKYELTTKTTTNTSEWSYYIPDMTGLDRDNTELAIYNDSATQFVSFVKLSTITNLNKFSKENNFFDYNNRKWANIKITKNNVESWWTWIPRYAYSNTGAATDVIFIDTDNEPIDGSLLPATYSIPEVFNGNNKKGIWISKYEPTTRSTDELENISTVPDLTGLIGTNVKVYLEIYNDNITGFTSNPVEYSTSLDLQKFAKENNWYDYSKKAWANIKVVNVTNNAESWWVWIPRYAYKNTGATTEILLIGANNKTIDNKDLPQGYELPEVFKENNKTGIWISKYELTQKQ